MGLHRKLDGSRAFLECFGSWQKCLCGGPVSTFQALFSGFEDTPAWSYGLFQQIAPPHQAKAGRQQIVWLRVIGQKSQADLLNPHRTIYVKGL
jgi:hypothetical protein